MTLLARDFHQRYGIKRDGQLARVLRAADAFNGTCQADFCAPDVCDGLAPISRVAARIEEADDRFGMSFERIGWRGKTRVYRLASVPEVGSDGGPQGGSAPVPDVPPGEVTVAASPGEQLGIEIGTGDVPHWRDWEAA